MAINFDPKVTGAHRTQQVTPPTESAAGQAKKTAAPGSMQAMEPPPSVPDPEANAMRPSPGGRTAEIPLFQRELAKLRLALQAKGTARLEAADEALVFAASYAMRRSRGARRQALDLCEAVTDDVPERAELARRLRYVLIAEGYLHDTSAASTLKACRGLIRMLAADAGETLDDDDSDDIL